MRGISAPHVVMSVIAYVSTFFKLYMHTRADPEGGSKGSGPPPPFFSTTLTLTKKKKKKKNLPLTLTLS